MLLKEIIAVYSGIHTKQIGTICKENVKLLILKEGDTSS
jgi:hypothetical protein